MPKLEKPGSGKFQAVIYDVDGTLYDIRKFWLFIAREIIKAIFTAPIKSWREWKVMRAYCQNLKILRKASESGHTIKGNDNPQVLLTAHSMGIKAEEVQSVVKKWMEKLPENFLPYCARKQVIDTVKTLHKKRLSQGVYSNYPADRKLKALGVSEQMQAIVWSGESKVRSYKPCPKGFLVAAERLGVHPSKTLYVGDNSELDGKGARMAGMSYVSANKFVKMWVD